MKKTIYNAIQKFFHPKFFDEKFQKHGEPESVQETGIRAPLPDRPLIISSHRPNPFENPKSGHRFHSVTGFENYELPGFDLLDADQSEDAPEADRGELLATQRTIVEMLRAFGIEVTPGDITRWPTITRYEIYPSTGFHVSRISQLEADLARATCAERINILTSIPGKDTVGIELANSQHVAVPLHQLLYDPEFRSAKKKIPLALGKDLYGNTVIRDLAAMPHLLVAGATGSGKSVCINSIINSMLYKFGPDELRFIMVDPKVVEMQMYNKLPHLVVPVVTDSRKAAAALKWVVNEMEKRYRIFARVGVRNFDGFNSRTKKAKEKPPESEVAPQDRQSQTDLFTDIVESSVDVGMDASSADFNAEAPVTPASHQAPPWWADEALDDEAIEEIAEALNSGDLLTEDEDYEDPYAGPEHDEGPERFPYIVVIIDDLADLMQTAPTDVGVCLARIARIVTDHFKMHHL